MKILLVDGTNMVMRWAFAMIPEAAAGDRNGATEEQVLRVLASVERVLRECATIASCTHVVVAVDSSVDSWRKQLYPDYKSGRRGITGLWSNRLQLYLSPRGWLVMRHPGEEADDVLATLAHRITASGRACAVLSGDSDLLQLIAPLCEVWRFGDRTSGERMIRCDDGYVLDKFGVHARDLRVYKALVGERGDDLPGVQGIGPKRALKILSVSVEPEAIRTVVHPEQFDLAMQLVTLNTDVPLASVEPARCKLPEAV